MIHCVETIWYDLSHENKGCKIKKNMLTVVMYKSQNHNIYFISFLHLTCPQIIINYFKKWKTFKFSYKNFIG